MAAWVVATNEEKLDAERWAGELGDPNKPWPELLTALLDLQIGAEWMRFTVDSLASAADGRSVRFFVDYFPVSAQAVLERTRHLALRCTRTGVVDRHEGDGVVARAEELLGSDAVASLRHQTAHGGFAAGGGSTSVISSPERDRLWELQSLVGFRRQDDILDPMYRSALLFRDRWLGQLDAVRGQVESEVTALLRRLLEDARARR